MRIVYCPVGGHPQMKNIPNTLEAMQNLVGGNIEPVRITGSGIFLICNEEGRIRNLPLNRVFSQWFKIFGNYFYVKQDGENFTDLGIDECCHLMEQEQAARIL